MKRGVEQQFVEAEQLLLDGYEGMLQREDSIPPIKTIRFIESMQRLVDHYQSWHEIKPNDGFETKAALWKRKLEEYQVRGETKSKINQGK